MADSTTPSSPRSPAKWAGWPGLTAALTTDVRSGLTGVSYTAPLREDMLRAISQADRPDTRNGLAQQRLQVVGDAINDLFGAVTIVTPTGSYTLATEHSPLPLALHNGLAVPIRVRLHLDVPPGMTVTDLGEIELPPGYLPLRVPIEVNFTQRVAIDVAMHTPDGVPLGEPVRMSVHSNAYGKVLFADHDKRGRGAGGAGRDDGCGTGSEASRTPPTSTARTHPSRTISSTKSTAYEPRRPARTAAAPRGRTAEAKPGTTDRAAATDRPCAVAGHLAAAPS